MISALLCAAGGFFFNPLLAAAFGDFWHHFNNKANKHLDTGHGNSKPKKKILRWCNKSPKFVTHTGKNVAVDHNWDYCSPNSSTRYTSCGDLNIPHHLHVSKFGFP